MYGIVNVGGAAALSAPKLTALTPVGTVVGTSGWTGTGEFNTDPDENNSKKFNVNLLSKATSQTFYRINLKLAEGEDWQSWSAYYDYNGEEYAFYYSRPRGVYDGLVPYEGLTIQKAIDKVRWVYGRKPELIRYGDVNRILKYSGEITGDSLDGKVWFSDDPEDYWNPGDGRYSSEKDYASGNVGDYAVFHALYSELLISDEATLKKIPLPALARAELGLCVDGEAEAADMSDATCVSEAQRRSARIPMDIIDNWEE